MTKRIFIFDLDDTLGRKTPQFPEISKINGNALIKLGESGDNILCIATSRPRYIAERGLRNSGISIEDMLRLFPIEVYEDGFYVISKKKVVYDAKEVVNPLFKKLKEAMFDFETKNYFLKNGFFLVGEGNVRFYQGKYLLSGFSDRETIKVIDVPFNTVLIQGQDNDVKGVYRSFEGFKDDNLKEQKPYFENIGKLINEFYDSRFPGWRNIAEFVIWEDAVDLYPKIGKDIYLKGHGLEIGLKDFDIPKDVKAVVCGDGKNDISMVEWARARFKNYKVISPSNISPALKEYLEKNNINHKILKEDCMNFGEGLLNYI